MGMQKSFAILAAVLSLMGLGSDKIYAAEFNKDVLAPSVEATNFCLPIFEHLKTQALCPETARESSLLCLVFGASIEVGVETVEMNGEKQTRCTLSCTLKGELPNLPSDISLGNVVVGNLLGVGEEEVALGDFKRLPSDDSEHVFDIKLFADPITDPSAFVANSDYFVLSYEGQDGQEHKKEIHFAKIKYNERLITPMVLGQRISTGKRASLINAGFSTQTDQQTNEEPQVEGSADSGGGCQLNPARSVFSGGWEWLGIICFSLLIIRNSAKRDSQ